VNESVKSFLSTVAVPPVVNVIRMGQATECRISVQGDNKSFPVWVTVTYAPPRHGCGWEQDALWGRTNDADLFAGSHGPSFNEAKVEPQELIDAIVTFLEREFAGCNRVEVTLIATNGASGVNLPIMVGDSVQGTLHEKPQLMGI
jgi:hypothetical protein